MKNHIAEDLPARKFAPAAAGSAPVGKDNKKENSGKTPEERAKQAVYDIRYKARREDIPLRQAFSEYMQNSSMGGQERNMVKQILFGKEGGGMKAEDFNPILKNAASDNVAKALFKVFVEQPKPEITEEYIEELTRGYVKQQISRVDRDAGKIRYKIRVTDKKTKTSYVRYATREKITELRANPNIESVEMTEYGEPYEGERKKGSQTARVAAGRGLDPVGQEDGDVNNNGIENDKSDKYLMKRRGAIGNAIATRKEEFIHETETQDSNTEKLDYKKGKVNNKVTIAPTQGGNERVGLMAHNELEGELIAETGYSKFLDMIQEKTLTDAETAKKEEIATALKSKYGKTPKTYAIATSVAKKVAEEMECGSDDNKKKKGEKEVDPRSIPTTTNLIKNKLRAMGIRNPMVMVSNEEDVKEDLQATVKSGLKKGADFMKTNPVGKVVSAVLAPVGTGRGTVTGAEQKQKIQQNVAKEEVEMVDERRREDKGTPRKPRDKAFELVANSMGANRLGVQPRGKRKDRTSPVQAEPPEITPAQKEAKNRASRERGNEFMRDTRGT